jgi:hypothetical protein
VVNRRLISLLLAAVVLSAEAVVASLMLGADRPARYGWQMYSAVPYNPQSWAVTDGHAEPMNIEQRLVYGRAEIDRVALIRAEGCELTQADVIRIELSDDITIVEVVCR